MAQCLCQSCSYVLLQDACVLFVPPRPTEYQSCTIVSDWYTPSYNGRILIAYLT